jgi:hypothetical protein
MKAEEARKKSWEAANKEIVEIKILIKQAVELGKMKIWLEEGQSLKEGTVKWLKGNGYRYDDDVELGKDGLPLAVDGRFYPSISW